MLRVRVSLVAQIEAEKELLQNQFVNDTLLKTLFDILDFLTY
ncbi:MAG: hypothetical protein RLZZ479_783 [Bacteroidota bacterium]